MKTAVILGSGISGISLAEILSRNNYKVIILEKSPFLGGDASLATQKWYHSGWLYASLPQKAAMDGCFKATNLYSKVYGNLSIKNKVNMSVDSDGIAYYPETEGWFTDQRIHYLFAKSTSEMGVISRLYWPLYLRFITYQRMKKNYGKINFIDAPSNDLIELMNFWEKKSDGYNCYDIVKSSDAKIETKNVIRSLIRELSNHTEIETESNYKLIENSNSTSVKIGRTIIKPDIMIMATGKSLPSQLIKLGYEKMAKRIKSIKSPILVLNESLSLPDMIRFTPIVSRTINHIKYNVSKNISLSTVGSYYSIDLNCEPDKDYYKKLMCEMLSISEDQILGTYFGIKTEYVKESDRKYNHALVKINNNNYFALAGKFSQFPLLVDEFSTMIGLNMKNNENQKIKFDENLLANSLPTQIYLSKKG